MRLSATGLAIAVLSLSACRCAALKNDAGKAVGEAEVLVGGPLYPIKAYREQVSPQLWRGSRIDDLAGYARLELDGFRGIVDLRAERSDCDQQWHDDRDVPGLQCLHIPVVDNTAPTVDQVRTFLEWLGDPNHLPAYVHCEAGVGRTGVFVAAYRVVVQGWSPQAALAEMLAVAKRQGSPAPDQAQQAFVLSLVP